MAPPIRIVDIGPYPEQPNLGDPISELKYVGPVFTERFAAHGIVTMQDLRERFLNNTKANNTTFLRTIFLNPRRRNMPAGYTGCLGEHTRRGGAAGNRYLVRRINAFGFNAVVEWFRQRHAHAPGNRFYRIVKNRRLPNRMRRRTYETAWPRVCH